jgi:ABC-type sugar transport system ATPase subunit
MVATLEQARLADTTNSGIIVASLEAVNKNYGNVPALREVDFRVRAGEVVALLGPNGAGKTTAVKLLLGLMQPNSGRVRVFGGDPTNPENRMKTGAMLQVGRRASLWEQESSASEQASVATNRCTSFRVTGHWPPVWEGYGVSSTARSQQIRGL